MNELSPTSDCFPFIIAGISTVRSFTLAHSLSLSLSLSLLHLHTNTLTSSSTRNKLPPIFVVFDVVFLFLFLPPEFFFCLAPISEWKSPLASRRHRNRKRKNRSLSSKEKCSQIKHLSLMLLMSSQGAASFSSLPC